MKSLLPWSNADTLRNLPLVVSVYASSSTWHVILGCDSLGKTLQRQSYSPGTFPRSGFGYSYCCRWRCNSAAATATAISRFWVMDDSTIGCSKRRCHNFERFCQKQVEDARLAWKMRRDGTQSWRSVRGISFSVSSRSGRSGADLFAMPVEMRMQTAFKLWASLKDSREVEEMEEDGSCLASNKRAPNWKPLEWDGFQERLLLQLLRK